MPRPRTAHVQEVKAALAARLRDGFAQPGGRFLSTRAVASRFEISYQTAHRLLAELEAEGLLQRRAASGSYLPGERRRLQGVQLIFHGRAKRKGSFGAHLLQQLETGLRERGIRYVRTWATPPAEPRLRSDYYPVIWESVPAVQATAVQRRFALLLNDRPPPGLGSGVIDAVTTDDFSGGACAAQLLQERLGTPDGLAVLGGPVNDPRSSARIAGFRMHAPDAHLLHSESWFVEGGRAVAESLLHRRPRGIFACNDRLAEALITHSREHGVTLPPLVGFDNAPVAERLRLTTIGIPWESLVTLSLDLITTRLAGTTAAAKVVTLAHDPVSRLTA